jgi:hypothetical protein
LYSPLFSPKSGKEIVFEKLTNPIVHIGQLSLVRGSFEAANEEVVFFDGTILTIPAISSEKQEGAYQDVKFKLYQ